MPGARRTATTVTDMRQRGFTLIELVITMVVIAILAAIAVPSYNGYVSRSRAAEATGTLGSLRLRMEQAYQDNGNYGAGGCAVATVNTDFFDFVCNLTNGGQGFTVTATGKASAYGYSFSIDEQGNRRTLAFPNAGAANCWLVKAGVCS
jgi:type IV pilus assembly protein PilE